MALIDGIEREFLAGRRPALSVLFALLEAELSADAIFEQRGLLHQLLQLQRLRFSYQHFPLAPPHPLQPALFPKNLSDRLAQPLPHRRRRHRLLRPSQGRQGRERLRESLRSADYRRNLLNFCEIGRELLFPEQVRGGECEVVDGPEVLGVDVLVVFAADALVGGEMALPAQERKG